MIGMGFHKNQMLKYQERGYSYIDKVACEFCVGDYALKQFIANNGKNKICDYCSKDNVCIDVESLIGKIMDGISHEYEEAANCMSVEKGEYIGACTWDTHDLMHEKLADVMELNNELLEDIVKTMDLTSWCEKDPYQLRQSRERVSMWNAFTEMVKKNTRYVFFRMHKKENYYEDLPFLILDHIGEGAKKLDLIKKLPRGTKFYRGRMHDNTKTIKYDCELSSPPHEKAKSNRMSAEGIAVFYGANDILTTITEIYDSKYKYATIAAFENLNDLQILDLTEIEKIPFPSLFDEDRWMHREPLKFFRKLTENLTRPIDVMKNIEYIPAQIVAEYFRFLCTYDNKPIDGIAYGSSKPQGGI
ncbi:RES domain-containing protein, partial [Selenomonadales bacterium OttesenSCG-928-I06]|nr:RES domain-containing protein [Selenomonadales bacterium OttesenSCG-928-I06]